MDRYTQESNKKSQGEAGRHGGRQHKRGGVPLPVEDLTQGMQSLSVGERPLSPLPETVVQSRLQHAHPYALPVQGQVHSRQLPPQSRQLAVLNGVLGATPQRRLEYDIRQHPASASYVLQHGEPPMAAMRAWRNEQATFPGLESLTIRAEFMADKPIVVFPSNSSDAYGHYAVVSVLDVLMAVYREAQLCIQGVRREGGLGLEGDHLWGRTKPSGGQHSSTMWDQTGWRWGGLVPSRTERDVWLLVLQ